MPCGICEALRARRLHHQHAPRPRPLPGQGRVARSHVRRAARQGSRLLQGQGRLDAHRRPGHRQPRRERHRRRQRRHRDRRGVRGQVPEDRAGGRLLLRRGRARPGPALRGDEPRAALEAAGHLRLREQRLQRIHALLGVDGRRRAARAPRRSASRTETIDGQNVREVYTAASKYIERARARRGPGVPAVHHLPLSRPPRRRHRARLLPAEGGRAGVGHRARSRSRCTASG